MLWSRAAFGMPLSELSKAPTLQETLFQLLHTRPPIPLEVMSMEEWQETNPKALATAGVTGSELAMKRKSFREKTGELGLIWLREMAATNQQLQEKMALFWHGHFATRAGNPYFDQILLQQFRAGGLGNFGDLLRTVSQSPGMLRFLNNNQNKKGHQ